MKGTVLSLFDYSANMVTPWANAGYECICVDLKHEGEHEHENIKTVSADVNDYLPPIRDYEIVFAFPPCTNLAVSGARWFKDKGLDGLSDGIRNVERSRRIAEWANTQWLIENPVSTLSTYWRKPDYSFNPYEYDGYTDRNESYSKKTCLWTSEGFVMPDTAAADEYDERIHKMPPSEDRSEKRSETPLGFANAVFKANQEDTE